ncbi:hypothetical protein BH11BAC2_BH11BAC2_04040 [soil metagenome]
MSDLKKGLTIKGEGNFSGKKTNEDFNNKQPLKEDPNLIEEDEVKDQTIDEKTDEEVEAHKNAVKDSNSSYNSNSSYKGAVIGFHEYHPYETSNDRCDDVILFL